MEITLTSRYGSPEAGQAVMKIGIQLLERLEALTGEYSKDIDQIDIYFFVNGSITTFHKETGWTRYRIMKKKRCAIVDFVMTEEEWETSEKNIRKFLADAVRQLFEELANRIEKAKLLLDRELLFKDLQKALRKFSKDRI